MNNECLLSYGDPLKQVTQCAYMEFLKQHNSVKLCNCDETGEGSKVYKVKHANALPATVIVFPQTCLSCDCLNSVHTGIQCMHSIKVLEHLKQPTFDCSHFHSFFTMNRALDLLYFFAKDGPEKPLGVLILAINLHGR